jgi:hypothetical protein
MIWAAGGLWIGMLLALFIAFYKAMDRLDRDG